MNPIKFIGRQRELKKLNQLLSKKTASLVVVKGRRRIGKSRLVDEFAHNKPFLKFIGLAPTDGVNAQTQRDQFARLLSEQTGLPEIKTDDWSKLFALLAEKVKSGRFIVLFDEITWMADKDPTFLSKLQSAWELYYKKNPKLIFILCSSISAWVEKNILSSTGYFGRISNTITLNELPLHHCNQLLESIGFKRSLFEKFMLLSLTGGVPWYIELINPALSAEENIKSLCFEENATLVNEHKYIFHDLFGYRSEIYEKITNALAIKTLEYSELAKQIDYASSGTLSAYLEELIEAKYIARDFTWSLKTGRQSAISVYRLSDNYLRFYYKYIKPKMALIQKGQYHNISLANLNHWHSIMGFQFENLVLNHREPILALLNISPESLVADGRFYQRQTQRLSGCQIDYLVQTNVNTLFVCELKFSSHEIKPLVIKQMKEKINRMAVPRNHVCLPVLIHVNGVSDEVVDSGYFYKIINFSELLEIA